jgi:bifunctional non-homologous end joining protein LigD
MAKKSNPTRSRSTAASRGPWPDEANRRGRLQIYRAKRDFTATPEPSGVSDAVEADVQPGSTARFVVQRHRASSLHYDFRLEVDGVLASWAVPRGPSLDPKVRRLAVRVEDHPLGYYAFEGVIPAREYGAGDVIVWDWGTYRADPGTPDPARAIDDGQFKFELDGEKLTGAFVLVRTPGFGRSRPPDPDGRRAKWLLIHRRDAAAVPGWDAADEPRSVKTGRTNEEVAEGRRGRRTVRCRPRRAREPSED